MSDIIMASEPPSPLTRALRESSTMASELQKNLQKHDPSPPRSKELIPPSLELLNSVAFELARKKKLTIAVAIDGSQMSDRALDVGFSFMNGKRGDLLNIGVWTGSALLRTQSFNTIPPIHACVALLHTSPHFRPEQELSPQVLHAQPPKDGVHGQGLRSQGEWVHHQWWAGSGRVFFSLMDIHAQVKAEWVCREKEEGQSTCQALMRVADKLHTDLLILGSFGRKGEKL